MRAAWGILVVALSLAGCDQPPKPTPEPPANSEFGRFTVIPAGTSASGQAFAWRLDTKTGGLDFCAYDPGGFAGSKPIPQTLDCNTSAKKYPRD